MEPNRNIGIFAAVLGAAAVLAGPAWAQRDTAASAWSRTDQTQVRLVAASAATGTGDSLRLGLHFRLEPGWKIYWRSPGDAGYPPRPDWSGSRNLAGAEFRWPAPERFELFGLDTFGYGGEVVLPIAASLERAGAPLSLRLALDYLVCEKICIPYQAALALDLPAGAATASAHAHLIDRYVARVPGDGSGSGLSLERAAWRGGGTPVIEVTARALTPFGNPDLIVEAPPSVTAGFGRPTVSLSEEGRLARLRIPIRGDGGVTAPDLGGVPVTLTLVDGERSLERALTLDTGLPTPTVETLGFWAALAAALVGGLILNLMPCVLPVLSLKLLSFVGQGGRAGPAVRRTVLATAAGILLSFAGLAGAVVAAKAAGATVGWGIQFQQPVFLVAMALLVSLFAANLWGWFEIRLPRVIGDMAATMPGGSADHGSARGAFFTGVLATLLATPCSAPFVGTAIGFALTQGPLPIVAIFLTMGVGLALPYLAIALFPRMAAWLPRPGRWMLRLRAILGLALLGTALWLLSVVAAQIGALGALVLAGLVAAMLGILAAGRRAAGPRRLAGRAAVAAVIVLAVLVPGRFAAAPPSAASLASDLWRPFDAATIETLVREGRVVFVDVTADWCITCQVNKAAVVSRGDVAARLSDGRVVPMRADWTRPNDEIARYLASFGRYGIPFNVVYGPAAPEGIALPEILTREAVLAAFERAGPSAAGPGNRPTRGGG